MGTNDTLKYLYGIDVDDEIERNQENYERTQAKRRLANMSTGNRNNTGILIGDGNTSEEAKRAAEVAASQGVKLGLSSPELDAIVFILDIAGMIPGLGMAADAASGSISVYRGDWAAAAGSLFNFVPLIGNVTGAAKITRSIVKAGGVAGALKKLELAKAAIGKLSSKFDPVKKFINKYYEKIKAFIKKQGDKSKKTKSESGTGSKAKEKNQPQKCKPNTKCPVNPVQGIKILLGSEDTDFVLTGDLPLIWDRQYSSDSLVGRGESGDPIGWYGQGWSNAWSMQLIIKPDEDIIELIDNYGRNVSFPYISIGKSYYSRYEDIRLHHDAQGQYRITSGASATGDGVQLHFSRLNSSNSKEIAPLTYPRKQRLYCTGQSDAYGNRITLEYHTSEHKAHLPHYIKDSAGRVLKLDFDLIQKDDKQLDKHGLRLQQINELINISDSKLDSLLSQLDSKEQSHLQQAKQTSIHALIDTIEALIDSGKLSKSTLAPHTLVSYHYSHKGDLIEVNPHLTPTRRFDYKNHIMIAHHIEGGLSSYYEYDECLITGKVLANRISNGQTYHFDYFDDHTIVTEAKDTDNERQTTYHFNQDKHWTGITDGLGNRTTFILDDDDRVTKIINPDGSKTLNQYAGDTLASVKQLVDYHPITNLPQWRTQQYLYNDNRLIELLDPLGNSTTLAYDAAGQIKQITDANGNSTHIERDDKGRTTKQTLANGSSYHYEYNHKGELIKQIDCSGNPTQYQYDDLGRIILITDAKHNQTRLIYDHKHGNDIQHTPSPTHIIYPDGSQEHFVYDTLNRLTKHIDAKEQTTEYEYAADDLPIRRIDALGHSLTYEYDNLRRLIRLTNENSEVWTFEYDKADNLISETRFDGYTSHYDYDKNGQLVHQTDNPTHSRAEQRHTYLQRDLIGQLTHKHSLDIVKQSSTDNRQHNSKLIQRHHKSKYHYDLAGQLIKATSPDASTHLEYDNIGQLVSETLYRHHVDAKSNEERVAQTLTHEYDEIGNRIATTLPDGKVINQLYYGSGHLYNQSISDNDQITEIRHSERNELHQETTRYQGSLISAFDYDPMGRLTNQHSSHLSKDYSVVERNYSYDKIGQLTHISGQTRLGRVTPSSKIAHQFKRNHHYQYDKVGRLTKHLLTDFANHTGTTEVFAFDPASNRVPISTVEKDNDNGIIDNNQKNKQIHKSGRPTELTTHDSYITYTYDSHGRVLYKTKTPLGSDGKPLKQSGNAIVGYRKSHQFYYNANDELIKSISITQEGINLKEVTTTYEYDAFGRRIAKQTQTKEKTKFVNRQTAKIIKFPVQQHKTKQSQVNYLWDGNRQLQEQTDTHIFTTVYEQNSFEPVARLVWLQDGVEIAANEPEYQSVWEDEPDPLKIQVYHYHNDHLGTPNELTSQDGEVIWLADYEAWGNTAKVVWREEQLESVQVTSDELQPLRFQGQSFDVETGLHYNRFRYFDPDLGMFTTRDPIGLMGGSNVFQYAPNPTGWIDPFGLMNCKKQSEIIYKEKLAIIQNLIKEHNYTKRSNINKISGGVSGAIGYTKTTGILVGGSDHVQKGTDILNKLKKVMKQVDNAYSLCESHRRKLKLLAQPYIRKLTTALSMPQKVPITGKSV